MKLPIGQDNSDNIRNFAARLREDRLRICPKQLEFAELSGFQNTEISALENGKVKIRAEHLAQLAAAGIDVCYVVTGRRGGDLLPQPESRLLDLFRKIDVIAQEALLVLLERTGNNTNEEGA